MRRCPRCDLPGVTIAYDVFGPDAGEPVVLVCGLSQPAGGLATRHGARPSSRPATGW